MASWDEYERAGLYDPAIDADSGRRELLQWLERRGFSIEEMVAAFGNGGLGALAGDRKLVPGPRLRDWQASRLTGLSAAELEETATAFGFTHREEDPTAPDGTGGPDGTNAPDSTGSPDGTDASYGASREFALTEAEAEALAIYTMTSAIFSRAEAIGFIRVVGTAMARIADAIVSVFLADIEGPQLEASANELELAQKVLGAVELLDDFVPVLDPILRRHILQAIERTRLTVIDEQERLQYRYAVGFIDLVGFTPLSQEMSARELGEFIREFEGTAHQVVTEAGARLVKLIGDEVMFVAPDPDSACRVAQSLMSGFGAAGGRTAVPRGGLSYGEILVRGGDYYGDKVNLASRLADQAAPGELLVTERFAAGTTCMDFDTAGNRQLKGFADPVPVRSRRFDLPRSDT